MSDAVLLMDEHKGVDKKELYGSVYGVNVENGDKGELSITLKDSLNLKNMFCKTKMTKRYQK